MIVLKGQAIVRVPYDGVSKTMTVRKYLRYLHDLPSSCKDPLDEAGTNMNQNIIQDYNQNLLSFL